MILAALLTLRFGPLTPSGREFVGWALGQTGVGPYGRLHVEGLEGDVWRDFTIRRLTIDDGHGPWADARRVRVRWDWTGLVSRTLAVQSLDIRELTLLRRPIARPSAPGGASPLSLRLDHFAARIQLMPAFSVRYGLYDVTGRFDLRRGGGLDGSLRGRSLTHAGDLVDADFDLGKSKTVALRLTAREADGGAIAGSLGLPADQPFFVFATADGATDAGRFTVTSRSGALTPLAAVGAWTPTGGSASGNIALAASKLLAGWQAKLGPGLSFSVTDSRGAGGLDGVFLHAASDNVEISARGGADLGRLATGPKGLAVDFSVRQLQRLIAWPQVGAGRFTGVLTGGLAQWSVAGQGVVDGLSLMGYRMTRLAGPVRLEWRPRAQELQAAMLAEGGQGAGLFPALLGPRPRAAVGLAWLPNGRLLIRSLALDAPGLKLSGSGQQGLLGGLSFTGKAMFSNLSVVSPGARGVISASWSASQAGASPWSFAIDAGASGFVSGVDAVDRLLGRSPTLAGRGVWDGRALQIANAQLGGAAGQAEAQGSVGGDGALLLKTSWRAQGPIDLGAVTILGPTAGTANVAGSMAAPRADIAANLGKVQLPELTLTDAKATFSLAPTPAGPAGDLTLAASSAYGPARARSAYRVTPGGLALTGFVAEMEGVRAQGSLALQKGAPSSADLTLAIGPGALLTRGAATGRLVVTSGPAGAAGRLSLSIDDAVLRAGDLMVQKASLSAQGPLTNMPYSVEAQGFTSHGSWSTKGGGRAQASGGVYQLTFQGGGRLRNADFNTVQPVVFRSDAHGSTLAALMDVGGGRAAVNASAIGRMLAVKANLSGVDLGFLNQDFGGRIDAQLSAQGEGARLGGEMQARLTGAGARGQSAAQGLNGNVAAKLSDSILTVDAQLSGQGGLTSRAHFLLPAEASAAPFQFALAQNRPIQGDFTADGEVGPLWDLALGGDRTLTGRVHVAATLGGTLSDPRPSGVAELTGGTFSDAGSGLKLVNVGLETRLEHDSVDVVRFDAGDGSKGTLSGSGRVSLARGGASDFRLSMQKFRLLDNDIATATASGDALISRGGDGAVAIAGKLAIDRADIAESAPLPAGVTPMEVVEVHRQPGVGGRLQANTGHGPSVGLDVTLTAARGIMLKGRGLDAELSLDAHVGGTTAAPQLKGSAHIVRGVYDLAGKRFQIDTTSAIYLANDPGAIRLDLTATREDPALTAVVHIEGVATRPRITLTSTPPLPTDEVLSQVLFGTSTSQLSPTGAAALASAITSLGGGGGLDVTGNLRAFAHLDRLAFGGDTPGAIVSGGKYLTSNVYIELAGGANGPSGSVEWRPKKNLSVISRIGGPGGDSQVSVRWRKDY